MNKKKLLIICIVAIVVVALTIGIVTIATSGNNNKTSENTTTTVETKDNEKTNSKAKGDFWINTAQIPSETKKLSVKILDDIAGTPIDLTKLENSDYTFNFTIFDNDELAPGDYSVKTLNEIKGHNFYNEKKEIKVNNSKDELIFTIELSSRPSTSETTTYTDSINNNWWYTYLNEEKMFNKEFSSLSTYNNQDRLQEIFNVLGKPTHIYMDKTDDFTVKDGEIGAITYEIIYEYDGFTLQNTVIETYNKDHDFRMVNSYGLTYYTKEMYENHFNEFNLEDKKDVVDELV